ncbi:hypothetical protein GQ457_15G015470 [Hibiscus cannabinus]
MGSELQKTESKEAKNEKILINGPNSVSEKEYEDFVGPLIEALLDHSSYEKELFSIDVDDRSLTVSLDSRMNPFEEWGNDTCMRRVKLHMLDKKLKLFDASNKAQINACIGGLKLCILDKKLKLFVKSEKSTNLRRLFRWDPEVIRFSSSPGFVVEDLHTPACLATIPLVYRIEVLVAHDWKVFFNQIKREANVVADTLAKYGLRGTLGEETFMQPPNLVLGVLSMDVNVPMS